MCVDPSVKVFTNYYLLKKCIADIDVYYLCDTCSVFTSLENLDCDSELEDIQISTINSWEVKPEESTYHMFKKPFEITNIVFICRNYSNFISV